MRISAHGFLLFARDEHRFSQTKECELRITQIFKDHENAETADVAD